jgi:hypothetical protein
MLVRMLKVALSLEDLCLSEGYFFPHPIDLLTCLRDLLCQLSDLFFFLPNDLLQIGNTRLFVINDLRTLI